VVVECTLNAQDRIRISVRDTGAGLSPRSWRNSSALQSTRQEASGVTGTGIGLVVTKRWSN